VLFINVPKQLLNMVYLDPSEIISQKILPSFRKELVLRLSRTMARKDIAVALDLTPVAIHYYLKGLRGNSFEFNTDELEFIGNLAMKFIEKRDIFAIKTGFKKLVDMLYLNHRICHICGGKNCSCRF